jgi:hypothetical protein
LRRTSSAGTSEPRWRPACAGAAASFSAPAKKIEVADRNRYPDAFVVCSPVGRKETVVRDPVVVFEVLSEGSVRAGEQFVIGTLRGNDLLRLPEIDVEVPLSVFYAGVEVDPEPEQEPAPG